MGGPTDERGEPMVGGPTTSFLMELLAESLRGPRYLLGCSDQR